MKEVSLVFPHQLFEDNPCIAKGRDVFLLEDELYFRQYPFHKKKILLHRASMKFYEHFLKTKHLRVLYISCFDDLHSLKNLFSHFKAEGIVAVHYCYTADYLLERRLKRYSERHGISLQQSASPCFINTKESLAEYFDKKEKFFLHDFYIKQRKQLDVLMVNHKPVGGKWSFDELNRKRIPKGFSIPESKIPAPNQFITEAEKYVSKHFSDNYGDAFFFQYPATFKDALNWLDDFLIERLIHFGPFQDAIIKKESTLFHSILTPLLNTGLLTPKIVIDRVMEFSSDHPIPLSSLEGFIRQVIGWREFMRGVYDKAGVQQRTSNFWQHNQSLPASFYNATTGIEPVDAVISKLLNHAYSHHIERLMVMGNFMLLCQIHPNHVYKWFMEWYIDSYDWVMVPNVYGMSQFADGGLMSTKPYISGSNYLMKMGDYKKGKWCEVWDALYWRFIYANRDFFSSNSRTVMVANLSLKMDKNKLDHHLKVAEEYMELLC